jgi:hypothetical protein
MDYFWTMRILLLMGNWGEGIAALFGLAFLLVVVPIIALIGHLWGRHIEKQFDREPHKVEEAKPPKQVQGAPFFLWVMVAVMFASFLFLGAWIY